MRNVFVYWVYSAFEYEDGNEISADPGGRAVKGVGLRLLACWDYMFESRRGHEYLF
jgi:hypothetical protein